MNEKKNVIILSRNSSEDINNICHKMSRLPFNTEVANTIGDFLFKARRDNTLIGIYLDPDSSSFDLIAKRANLPIKCLVAVSNAPYDFRHKINKTNKIKTYQIEYPLKLADLKPIYEETIELENNSNNNSTQSSILIQEKEPLIFDFWKSEYVLKIEKIDKQHKWFFDFYNEFISISSFKTVTADHLPKYFTALMNLRHYAFLHFHTEEKLMLKKGFKDIVAHMNAHDHYMEEQKSFLNNFSQIFHSYKMNKEINMNDMVFLLDHISEFLKIWVTDHIKNEDEVFIKSLSD